MASPFSGKTGRLAGMWAAGQATKGLGDVMTTLREGQREAGDYLTGSYEAGLESLGTGYDDMLRTLQESYRTAPDELTRGRDAALTASAAGYGDAERALYEGQDRGVNELIAGRDTALGYGQEAMGQTRGNYAEAMDRMRAGYGAAEGTLGLAVAGWDPLVQKNMQGFDMYGNALGLGGQAGHDAATGAFRAGPGYEWRVAEATKAAQRAGNKIGAAYGGNTINAVTNIGSRLADQEYDEWVKNLSGFQTGAQNAVAGQSTARGKLGELQAAGGVSMAGLDTAEAAAINQILQNQGNISTTAGKNISDVYGTTAARVGDTRAKAGTDAAGLYARTGSGLADLALSSGTNQAKLMGDYASQMTGLAGQYGGAMGSLAAGTAGNVASAQQTANNQVIGAGTSALTAGQQAATNTWGAIMGGLGMGANLLGASLGTGSSTSLLGQLFK